MPNGGLYRRALAFGIGVVVVAVAVSLLLRSGSSASAGMPGPSTPRATPSASSGSSSPGSAAGGLPAGAVQQVEQLLAQRGTAILGRNSAAWLTPIASSATAFRSAQAKIYGRITSLRPLAWNYRFLEAAALTAKQEREAPEGWAAHVQLTYRLVAGGPLVTRGQYLTVVPGAASGSTASVSPAAASARPAAMSSGPAAASVRPAPAGSSTGTGWRIAGDSAGPTERDLWDLGPISLTSSSRCVVISSTTHRSLARRVAQTCRAAAGRVDDVWGRSWPRRTALVIPSTQDQLGTLLGSSGPVSAAGKSTGLNQTAAVTVGPVNGGAEEVLINPKVFEELQLIGVRIILTHELVHVATRATGSRDAPIWLAEGFADYVGYLGSGLPPSDIAGDALDQVRAGHLPKTLPPDADFNSASKNAAAAYGFGWVAARTIAASGGTKKLVAFYQAAAGTGGTSATRVDTAVRTVLGLEGTAAFVDQWRQQLKKLA